MYIEKVTESKLSGASNSQLGVLRLRFIQLWDKHFHQTSRDQLGSLSKADFLDRYKLLLKEMTRRAISPKTVSPIDKFVFDSTIFKFSVASLGDVVVVPDYCSIGGSFVRNPSKASDVDIVIRTPEGQRDETLELKLGRALAKVLHKDIEFIYHPSGPHSSYIPLFDLVLRAKDKMEIIRVKEGKSVDVEKGLSPAQRKECDEETERIKENGKKAEWPHKFKPAKYTHPNGHPRCLICGDEEEIGGICHKPEDLEKGVRPAFGSPGGKRSLAKTIVGYIPEHKTYVEPFVGGGAVLFAKEPGENEIINDLDPEIAFAYRFIKKGDFEGLKKLKWIGNKYHFEWLKKQTPKNDVDRFYKFLYTTICSYASQRKNFASDEVGEKKDVVNRLPKLSERLKNTKIKQGDYSSVIKEFDSKETFFYLDPPYPGEEWSELNIDTEKLKKDLQGIEGNFILSLNDTKENREIFKNFQIKKIKVERGIMQTGRKPDADTELLISNFSLKKTDIYLAKGETELNLEDFEYLIHHIEIKDEKELVHHCLLIDHIANTFEQSHLWIDKGKVYLDGKEIKEGYFHVIKGLELTQEVTWSDEEAMEAGIKPKEIKTGLTKKEKAKLW